MAYSPRNSTDYQCIAINNWDDETKAERCNLKAILNQAGKKLEDFESNPDFFRPIYCQKHWDILNNNDDTKPKEIGQCSKALTPSGETTYEPCNTYNVKCKKNAAGNIKCENGDIVFPVGTVKGRGTRFAYTSPGSPGTGTGVAKLGGGSPLTTIGRPSPTAPAPGLMTYRPPSSLKTPRAPGPDRGTFSSSGVVGDTVPAFVTPELDPGSYRKCDKNKGGDNIEYAAGIKRPDTRKHGAFRAPALYVRNCEFPKIYFDKTLIDNLKVIDVNSNYNTVKKALNNVVSMIRDYNYDVATGFYYNFDVEEDVVNAIAEVFYDYMNNGYRIELVLSWLFNYESRDLFQKYSFFGITGLGGEPDRKIYDDTENRKEVDEIAKAIPATELSKPELYKKVFEQNKMKNGAWYGLADYYFREKKSDLQPVTSTGKGGKGEKPAKPEDIKAKFQEIKTKLTKFVEENPGVVTDRDLFTKIDSSITALGNPIGEAKLKVQMDNLEKYAEILENITGEKIITDVTPTPSGGGQKINDDVYKNFVSKFTVQNKQKKLANLLKQVYGKITSDEREKLDKKLKENFSDKNKETILQALQYLSQNGTKDFNVNDIKNSTEVNKLNITLRNEYKDLLTSEPNQGNNARGSKSVGRGRNPQQAQGVKPAGIPPAGIPGARQQAAGSVKKIGS